MSIHRLTHFANPRAEPTARFPDDLKRILSVEEAGLVMSEISSWPYYAQTPLHRLDGLAAHAGLDRIWYKDEAGRFGLGSFKALGGAYAVLVQLRGIVRAKTGHEPSMSEFMDRSHRELLEQIVVTCATDGNHGRSVAWAARLFGCQCSIYLHSGVSEGREKAISSYGAQIVRVPGTYDDSLRQADLDARTHERILVSDTSYAGYSEIPRIITLGYTVIAAEIIAQLGGEIPTHAFVQGGVGGLASALCGYFWQVWGGSRPRFVVVEPESANCLQLSARKGSPAVVEGSLDTVMACLSCGEVSHLAWEILGSGCDDFMTVEDAAVAPAMKLLASGKYGDPQIVAGESAVAGLAAAAAAVRSPPIADVLELNADSRILVIGSEGATDPQLYEELLASV